MHRNLGKALSHWYWGSSMAQATHGQQPPHLKAPVCVSRSVFRCARTREVFPIESGIFP
jgi:hypothetical protein